MNHLIQVKRANLALLFALLLAYFALSSGVQAVNPPPDGGYPGGNTAEGQNALFGLNPNGQFNTAVGFFSLWNTSSSDFNTGIGAGALLFNTAEGNTATGAAALLNNTFAAHNTANGAFALISHTSGDGNTAVGFSALFNNAVGHDNIAVGTLAGQNIDGSNNIVIGNDGVSGESDTIRMGNFTHTTVYMPAIANTVSQGGNEVHINPIDGKLFLIVSSRRFKRDIQPMDKSSEGILALKPVTFHYKTDDKNTPCFGLIAEDVAEINPDLITRDKEGNPLTVRYDQVNAMLLNEFLKEHRRVEEQQATIAQLKSSVDKQQEKFAQQQKQIEVLTTGLDKVSARLEAREPAPQTVLNNQ
jgi:uncharacterized coiled-coil protein SlyX